MTTTFTMTKEEYKAQLDARKTISMDYELFTTLPYDIQNHMLTEMQSNLEWLKDWTYPINDILVRIKDNNPFKVSRGDVGIHKDLVMIEWGQYYNDTFQPSEIGLEWLERNGLDYTPYTPA